MRKRSFVLLAGAAAIVAGLVVGPSATAGPERASAGAEGRGVMLGYKFLGKGGKKNCRDAIPGIFSGP